MPGRDFEGKKFRQPEASGKKVSDSGERWEAPEEHCTRMSVCAPGGLKKLIERT